MLWSNKEKPLLFILLIIWVNQVFPVVTNLPAKILTEHITYILLKLQFLEDALQKKCLNIITIITVIYFSTTNQEKSNLHINFMLSDLSTIFCYAYFDYNGL